MADRHVGSVPVYIALGANLGERGAALDAAERALLPLADPPASYRCSPRYRSPAMVVPERPGERQPDYLNAVATLHVGLGAHALLDALQAIETACGRERAAGRRWGARTLDLDLLLYGGRCIDTACLVVPHPGIAARAFVLQPLHDLAPGLDVPGAGRVTDLLARLPAAERASLQACTSDTEGS